MKTHTITVESNPPVMSANIDHVEYPKQCRERSSAELRYVIQDCQQALEANPAGAKAGYYADEINYCAMELKRRSN